MNRLEFEKKIIDREQKLLKKFKISYYYLATGMEGRADIYPEKVIEAHSEDEAIYIYKFMFFESYRNIDFNTFLKKNDTEKYWGITIIEINKILGE